jgi:hypothetical protein
MWKRVETNRRRYKKGKRLGLFMETKVEDVDVADLLGGQKTPF